MKPNEKTGFKQYVNCFYGQQKAVVAIFEQVVTNVDTENDLDYTLIKSSHKNMLNAFSDLKKWLLEFLALQELKSNSYEARFFTIEALRKRGLNDVFLQKSNQLNQDLTAHQSPDMWLMF